MAGDAAHLTGPSGAQSMNVGLREAADLADRIVRVLRRAPDAGLLEEYGASRAWRSGRRSSAPHAGPGTRRSLLLPCIPASGDDLRTLLDPLS